ncbi:hypothetical protein AB0B28_14900 [Glycomyces sp. NPDC046736]|uniref:effector-associated constant component EACC1 n=1 Tax=Glycomyces sp. NPDC046736 TaxID=3155615 RepID=UPI0033EE431A
MNVELAVTGASDPRGELGSLLQWLSREPELRGRVAFAPAEPGEGELGAMQELLLAAIAAGGLDALGRTIAVWIKTRRSELEVTVTAPDGTSLQVNAKGAVANTIAKRLDP